MKDISSKKRKRMNAVIYGISYRMIARVTQTTCVIIKRNDYAKVV